MDVAGIVKGLGVEVGRGCDMVDLHKKRRNERGGEEVVWCGGGREGKDPCSEELIG